MTGIQCTSGDRWWWYLGVWQSKKLLGCRVFGIWAEVWKSSWAEVRFVLNFNSEAQAEREKALVEAEETKKKAEVQLDRTALCRKLQCAFKHVWTNSSSQTDPSVIMTCCGSETSLLCAYQEEKKAAIAKADAAKKAAEEEADGSQAAQRFWSPVQRPSVLKSIRGCKAKWRCAESKKRSRDCSFREEECLDGCSWNQAACDQLICESAKKHSREASVCLFLSAFSMSTSIVLRKAAEEATKAAIKAADEVRLLLKFSYQRYIFAMPFDVRPLQLRTQKWKISLRRPKRLNRLWSKPRLVTKWWSWVRACNFSCSWSEST